MGDITSEVLPHINIMSRRFGPPSACPYSDGVPEPLEVEAGDQDGDEAEDSVIDDDDSESFAGTFF